MWGVSRPLLALCDGARRRCLRGRRRPRRCSVAGYGQLRGRGVGGAVFFVWVRNAQSAEGLRQAQVAIHRGSQRAAQAVFEPERSGSKGTARSASGATRVMGGAAAGNGGMGAPRGQEIRKRWKAVTALVGIARRCCARLVMSLGLALTSHAIHHPAPTQARSTTTFAATPQCSTCVRICCRRLYPAARPPRSVPGLRVPM
jgi:hypothetical protein